MTAACEEHQASLLAYMHNELTPLGHTRLQAHLGHCRTCAGTEARLQAGLSSARNQSGDLGAEGIERLVERLRPYLGDPTPWLRWRSWTLAGASALAMAVVALLLWPSSLTQRAPTTPASPEAQLATQTVGEHLRLVTSAAWDGKVDRHGSRYQVRLTNGRAAFAFDGGDGRALEVETPEARVTVVGTRFAVMREPRLRRTRVAVAQGTVTVTADGTSMTLDAGEQLEVGTGGVVMGRPLAEPELSAFGLQHAHLQYATALAPAPRAHPRTKRIRAAKRAWRRAGATAVQSSSPTQPTPVAAHVEPSDVTSVTPDPLAELSQAESLARRGQPRQAAAIYQRMVRGADAGYGPYRDLAALEWAKLLGFELGQPARALALLEPLARSGSGEVRRQAQLSRCDLLGQKDACAAIRCLAEISRDLSAAPGMAEEARRLGVQWRAQASDCQE